MAQTLTDPAKLLLLAALLAKDRIISNNGKAFLKELVLRRDPRLSTVLKKFEAKESGDSTFLEHVHDLIRDESQSVYDELFVDTSLEVGKTLSKDERDRKQLNEEKSLIYGEVDYKSFYTVLRKIAPEPGTVFYDLGSGTSKAVFVARFTQDFGRCVGIEILPSLHQQARKIVDRYNSDYRQILCSSQNQHASVYMGSFLDFDWMDGDVIFANSTCFDDKLMADMSVQAEGLKPGTIFVTFTKGLTSKKFEVLERKRYRMSWGPATVFIHRRLKADGTPVGNYKLNLLPGDNADYDSDMAPIVPAVVRPPVPKYSDSYPEEDDEDEDEDEDDDEDDDGGNEDADDEEDGEEDGDEDDEGDDEDDDGDDDEEDNEDDDEEDATEIKNSDDHMEQLIRRSAGLVAALDSRPPLPVSPNAKVNVSTSTGHSPIGPQSASANLPNQSPLFSLRPPTAPSSQQKGSSSGGTPSGTPGSIPNRLSNSWMDSPQDSALLQRKRMAGKHPLADSSYDD